MKQQINILKQQSAPQLQAGNNKQTQPSPHSVIRRAPSQLEPYISNQRGGKSKDPFGYRISILALRNYPHKRAVKIKIIIYEEYYTEKDMGLKYQFGTIYHDENEGYDSYNPNFKNKMDVTGAIAYNESFYVPENLQEAYTKNQKQIYMLLIAAQKDQKKMTNEPKPYCWYSFKITHFGQIKQGRFTVNLYGDDMVYPFPADMNKMKKKKQQQLTFQIQQVLLDEHSVNASKKQYSNPQIDPEPIRGQQKTPSSQRMRTPQNDPYDQSKVNMNYPLKMKNFDDDNKPVVKVSSAYFYQNQKQTQFSHVQLKKPLNFDVCVSGLRTLPSYIGPVKLQMSFIDADSSHVLTKQQFLAEISTDLYNPGVSYTRQIRNQSKIPPSTMILIRMIAISAIDYQVYCLGFSVLYLFFDREGNPIKSNRVSDYLMTCGYYQLPIFWGNPQAKYISIQSLLQNYPPIPCSSILIGVLENASKISNPMPPYSQKVYNTILFQVDDSQAKLFQEQYKREPIDTNTLISGYLQYKGIKKNYSGQQISKYLFKTLQFSPENLKNKIQLKWMAEYNQNFGVNFVIDKLNIPETEQQYYYFITSVMSPPAGYYKKKAFDLTLHKTIDFKHSLANQIVFVDKQSYLNPIYFQNASMIVQINRIKIFQTQGTQADSNIQGYAYAVIPVFEQVQKIRSINACQINVPLLQGDFDSNMIDRLQKNLPAFMESLSKAKKLKASLDIRILNGYFMNQYPSLTPTINAKSVLYKDIAPQKMSWEDALEEVLSILSNNYNLHMEWS